MVIILEFFPFVAEPVGEASGSLRCFPCLVLLFGGKSGEGIDMWVLCPIINDGLFWEFVSLRVSPVFIKTGVDNNLCLSSLVCPGVFHDLFPVLTDCFDPLTLILGK